jgi:hypothetical protein
MVPNDICVDTGSYVIFRVLCYEKKSFFIHFLYLQLHNMLHESKRFVFLYDLIFSWWL